LTVPTDIYPPQLEQAERAQPNQASSIAVGDTSSWASGGAAIANAAVAALLLAATEVLVDPALPLDEQFCVSIAPILVGRTPAVYGSAAIE
jgi:hypothetical protein